HLLPQPQLPLRGPREPSRPLLAAHLEGGRKDRLETADGRRGGAVQAMDRQPSPPRGCDRPDAGRLPQSRRAHPRRHGPPLPASKPPPSPPSIEHLTALQARDIQPNERYPRVYRPSETPRQPRNSTPTRV